MKKLFSFLLIWFVYTTNSYSDIAGFLNKLPKGTETKIVVSGQLGSLYPAFLVYYNTDKQVK